MDCVFCKIVKGEIGCAKVFEDNDVLAFLDVNPVSKGHCLVIPKIHFENIFNVEESILQKVIVAAKNISEKIKVSLQADGINLIQANGKVAGQEIMHFHLHIIPRHEGDGLKLHGDHPKIPKPSFEELKSLAKELI